ncbi:hypothetical protein ISCGN_003540 [Ixodes scapularis]
MMVVDYERYEAVRLAPIMQMVDFSILSGSEKAPLDAFDYLRAFDNTIWMLLFMALFVLSLLIALPDWLPPSGTTGRNAGRFFRRAENHAWELLSLFLLESSPRHYRHSSQRFLVGAWLIMVVVLANSFASLLKSNQAVGNFMPAVDSIVDLAGRPEIRPVLPKNTTFEKYGKISGSPHVQKVWAAAYRMKGIVPYSRIFSDAEMWAVSHLKAAIMIDKISILFNIARFCEREDVRNFYLAKEVISPSPTSYGISKYLDRRVYKDICTRSRWISEAGLITKWMEESLGNWERCIHSGVANIRGISLEDSQSWFLLWAILLCFACTVFILELFCARKPPRNSRAFLRRV